MQVRTPVHGAAESPQSPRRCFSLVEKLGWESIGCEAGVLDGIRVCHGAARSLVAFDIDKTVLHQGDPSELKRFKAGIGQTLIRLARLDFRLAAVTGNSLAQLSVRFLSALVEELCAQNCLELLSRFHFFCNGAAVYVHVDPQRSSAFAQLLNDKRRENVRAAELHAEARQCIFEQCDSGGGGFSVKPSFILSRYAGQCCIPREDADVILQICSEVTREWWDTVCRDGVISDEIRSQFYIANGRADADQITRAEAQADGVNTEASLFSIDHAPEASARTCTAADGKAYVLSCNVLPVISFRHARGVVLPHTKDPRLQLIKRIKAKLRAAGLVRYIVSAGGRSSIDVSHHLVNKRSAITWLLRYIGTEGVAQVGEPLGANTVFFGDEVVLNGNDLITAEIPGILTFAVNELTERVPFRTNIEVPTDLTMLKGPEATQAVLEDIATYAEEQIKSKGNEPWSERSALAAWKERRLRERLQSQCMLMLGMADKRPGIKVTYRRLEAATAALTALTRRGEGLDDFADQVIDLVDNVGKIANLVRERQFEAVQAQGHSSASPVGDHREDDLIEELQLKKRRTSG